MSTPGDAVEPALPGHSLRSLGGRAEGGGGDYEYKPALPGRQRCPLEGMTRRRHGAGVDQLMLRGGFS